MKRRQSTVSTAVERSTKFWAAWCAPVLAVCRLSNLYAGRKQRSGSFQGHTEAEGQLFPSGLVLLELKLFQLMTRPVSL